MLENMPDAVRAYLALTIAGDRTAAIVAFAEDAHVTDDGASHDGVTAVRAWLDRPAGDYTFTTTPLSAKSTMDTEDGEALVTCRVEGNFPGGLVDLDYRFTLDETRRIARLVIGPHL
ncbi:nuclear transport factor 2 family protein [Amycolatopsis sp., V23-08]|uniref:Nuclear transport factor 2 family protein n=1 Tax=Amycolatopsis heterodermiae TaxID=3110235 RepID=A0ABU5RAD0_9PSEU|nr:nuclear transport factor 2 family protein [Amycolatopsis sp., V23-08]MEA5363093.1 nuclear transport factor 2 family protein [Amycolatopsis sp., V23-08]